MPDFDLEHHTVSTNGIRLHVVQCGPADGPLVLLLHGFPEFWYAWRHQIQALAQAGYRVWAPDQRGYNLSDKPEAVRDYTVDKLALDVIGLIDAARRRTAAVVGHDWGAAVAWHLAAHHAGIVRKVAVLNVPHPRVMARALRKNGQQMRKSWYMFFFQLPGLPELALRARCWWLVRQSLLRSSRPGTFSEADINEYVAAWEQPRAMHSMLSWYRAAVRHAVDLLPTGRVKIPLHIIWGQKDAFLQTELAEQSLALCDAGQLTYLPASHWVQHEEPEKVNQLLLEFLQ